MTGYRSNWQAVPLYFGIAYLFSSARDEDGGRKRCLEVSSMEILDGLDVMLIGSRMATLYDNGRDMASWL